MSLDTAVFSKKFDDTIIPKLVARLNQLDMHCEINPDFSFLKEYPMYFKIRLKAHKNKILVGKDFFTWCDYYVEPFNLINEKEKLIPKQNFWERIIGKTKSPPQFLYDSNIDKKIAVCEQLTAFNYTLGESFQVRMVWLCSAILSEITNGICIDEGETIRYNNKTIVEQTFKDVIEHEASIKNSDWNVHEFENWE